MGADYGIILPKFRRQKCTNLLEGEIFLTILSRFGGSGHPLWLPAEGVGELVNRRFLGNFRAGQLFLDFDSIFNPLFGPDNEIKKSILGALGSGPLSGEEISSRLGIPRNGHLSANLRALCEGGFIADDIGLNPETGKTARVSKYRLKDNYTRSSAQTRDVATPCPCL